MRATVYLCLCNSELCRWLWSKLLRQELATFVEFRNGTRVRKQRDKSGPSGMSRNTAFSLPEKWGGRDCLLPLRPDQLQIVREIKAAMGGDELLEFNTVSFRQRAVAAYDSLHIQKLSFENVWDVFDSMYILMFP